MTQAITQLSNNAISSLIQANQESESITVQIIDFQAKKDKHYITISDGNFMVKALPKQQGALDPNNDLNTIICIKRHMTGKNNVVGIVQFEKLFNYKTRIGNPQEYSFDAINPENIETYKLQKQMIQLTVSLNIQNQTQQANQNISTHKKQLPATTASKMEVQKSQKQEQKKTLPPPSTKKIQGSLTDYETIKMLFVGMDRWTIISRIVKKDYSEFISKKSGKQTKVLNIQLMDRAGMKISGVFFGEAAEKWKDQLIKDRVYKISQGQIRQQSYNNSKNQKISPFKLVFTTLSIFDQVSDTSSIAKNQDAAITLGQCIQRRVLGQQYDIICILIKIQETIEVKKEGGMLKKTNLLVADPVKGITVHAVVWNQNIIPDSSLVGKAIILSRFKLSEYKSSLTLGSIFKSSIIPVEEHHYRQYQNKAMNQYNQYQKLHEIKYSGTGNQDEVCMTIKQLETKLQYLGLDEWARGEFTVHINKFSLKRWQYDGCPSCQKSAESLSNCSHCNKYVQKTVNHFIVGVEICDSTGSLWTTAYDEWAKKIFSINSSAYQQEFIESMLKLDAQGLKQRTEQYLFEQFRLKISSKKDKEGRIKHHASKVLERNYAQETIKNIELINKLTIS